MLQQSELFAKRLERERPELNAQVARAFDLAFGRSVTKVELADAVEFAREFGLTALCRALFNANEFLFVP